MCALEIVYVCVYSGCVGYRIYVFSNAMHHIFSMFFFSEFTITFFLSFLPWDHHE